MDGSCSPVALLLLVLISFCNFDGGLAFFFFPAERVLGLQGQRIAGIASPGFIPFGNPLFDDPAIVSKFIVGNPVRPWLFDNGPLFSTTPWRTILAPAFVQHTVPNSFDPPDVPAREMSDASLMAGQLTTVPEAAPSVSGP